MRLPWTRDWELIDKEVVASPMDRMMANGVSSVGSMPSSALNGTVILTFKCKLTGRVKVKVVRT